MDEVKFITLLGIFLVVALFMGCIYTSFVSQGLNTTMSQNVNALNSTYLNPIQLRVANFSVALNYNLLGLYTPTNCIQSLIDPLCDVYLLLAFIWNVPFIVVDVIIKVLCLLLNFLWLVLDYILLMVYLFLTFIPGLFSNAGFGVFGTILSIILPIVLLILAIYLIDRIGKWWNRAIGGGANE